MCGCRRWYSPSGVHTLETQLAAAAAEMEHAVRAQDFARAAALREREQKLRAELRMQRSRWEQANSGSARAVTGEDVAEIVSLWTGIPVAGITSSESQQLLQMEASLRRRVVGQEEAVCAVLERHPPQPRRARRSEPADRQLSLPRTDRRRQDGALPRACRGALRR